MESNCNFVLNQDEVLNELIKESIFKKDHISIANVIHYLNQDKINCTAEGIWYKYKNHYWQKISDMEIIKTKLINEYKIKIGRNVLDDKIGMLNTLEVIKELDDSRDEIFITVTNIFYPDLNNVLH